MGLDTKSRHWRHQYIKSRHCIHSIIITIYVHNKFLHEIHSPSHVWGGWGPRANRRHIKFIDTSSSSTSKNSQTWVCWPPEYFIFLCGLTVGLVTGVVLGLKICFVTGFILSGLIVGLITHPKLPLFRLLVFKNTLWTYIRDIRNKGKNKSYWKWLQ